LADGLKKGQRLSLSLDYGENLMRSDPSGKNLDISTSGNTSGKPNKLRLPHLYAKTYKNWPYVLATTLLSKYHTKALLRDGREIILSKHSQASLIAYSSVMKMNVDVWGDTVSLRYKDKDLHFKGAFHDGDILGIFINREYESLNVSGCTVIDVGASIGDSAIYFAESGAVRVLAIEPFPTTYNKLLENIQINGYQNLITPINALVSGSKGTLKIDDKVDATGSLRAADVSEGVSVESIALRDLLGYVKGDVVLKMDCEGCEYDVFKEATQQEMATFKEIFLEFHHGGCPKDIIRKLDGFRVSVRGSGRGLIHAINKGR
jgi:FkbM family methyltransferase